MRRSVMMVGVVLAGTFALPVSAQMSSGMMNSGMMMGAPRSMLNLVSPATSPTQVLRGELMFNSMMGGAGTSMMGGLSGSSSSLRLRLLLVGVVNGGVPVTSTGNHLLVTAHLTSAAGDDASVPFDLEFDITSGLAVVSKLLTLPSFTPPATLELESVKVVDGGGTTIAVQGVALGRTLPSPTPNSGSCKTDADCNDGNPNTHDICTPHGCQHGPMGMGSM